MPIKGVSDARILPLASEKVPPALTVHHLKEFRQKLEKSRMNLG